MISNLQKHRNTPSLPHPAGDPETRILEFKRCRIGDQWHPIWRVELTDCFTCYLLVSAAPEKDIWMRVSYRSSVSMSVGPR